MANASHRLPTQSALYLMIVRSAKGPAADGSQWSQLKVEAALQQSDYTRLRVWLRQAIPVLADIRDIRFISLLTASVTSSPSPPTSLPTTGSPTDTPVGSPASPPPTEATALCLTDCPCCDSDEWPEFVAAVERYTPSDSCFVRLDDTSDIIAFDLCETSTLAGFESGLTAYMSMDYQNRGGTPEEPVYYCGDSGSGVNFLTAAQGAACESLLESRVEQEGGVCNDVFLCSG